MIRQDPAWQLAQARKKSQGASVRSSEAKGLGLTRQLNDKRPKAA